MKLKATQIGGRFTPFLITASLAFASSSHAAVVSGAGEANGLSANATVSLLGSGLLELDIPAVAFVSDDSSSPYSGSDSVLEVDESVLLLADVNTGVISTTIESDVDGGAGIKSSTSTAIVNGLDLALLGGIAADTLTVSAGTVSSSATVSGDFGAMTTTGVSSVENLEITVLGDVITIPVDAFTTPNFVLVDLAGIRIVLNEQIDTSSSGAGFDNGALEVNAIRITVDADLTLTGVGADITVAQSIASLNSVPEPSSVAMGGLGLMWLCTRRRRRLKL